ncbi:MAG: hypothetical protein RBS48_08575 [Ignavibacteriaceae bacterium]|jgi:uncharacterized protein YoxC|nr:hypothetical protein [Ignavibacteriaceae bacterium]
MNVLDIFLIILALSASALCISFIYYLKRVVDKVEKMQEDIAKLVDTAIPVLENLNDSIDKSNRIITGAEHYWDEIENTIEKVKDKIKYFTPFSILRSQDFPAGDLITNLKALYKGISTFWSRYKNK